MSQYVLTWLINGQYGSKSFHDYQDASDTAGAIISLNRYCYVAIHSGRHRVFSYEKLKPEESLN